MVAKSTTNTKKTTAKSDSKKASVKKNTIVEKKISQSDNSVSVITKTTKPKVIIQSENINKATSSCSDFFECKNTFIVLICKIIMCVIVLIMFFLVLKIHNTVNELNELIQYFP